MMKNGRAIIHRALLLGVFLLALCPQLGQVVKAQNENGSFVFSTNHFDGVDFSSSMIPPSIDTIYLLADVDNAITPRLTDLYYWPLTNETKASWEKRNVVLNGTLEIEQNGVVISKMAQTDYVIQYDNLDKSATLGLYFGDEAGKKHKEFVDLRNQYRDALFAYDTQMDQYRSSLEQALQDVKNGKINKDQLPEPPVPLKDFSLFSTDLLRGSIVNLPEGTYRLRLILENGSIQPGSEKTLIVFKPITQGIGYQIMASERWTDPEYSNSPQETIYTIPDKQVFIKPFWQNKYVEKYYVRMNNPQDTASRSDRTVWIPTTSAISGVLQLNNAKRIFMKEYYVRQTAGSTLGYEITEYAPTSGEQSTFTAFALSTSSDMTGRASIALLDENGHSLPGSAREVRTLQTGNGLQITLLSVIPLLLGFIVIVIRQLQVRKNE